jgi:hypothetical protein
LKTDPEFKEKMDEILNYKFNQELKEKEVL